ncbi:Nif3-like dinuclear metal center hexameric protein [Thiothrix fructosivorans]|uniref:GTP cyclohydrolase 1 type 2 homolog n=1 Tax=Thiothrix fructosivorans TaxID=111770 RepID=A0A8B0SIC8_9GAMM|nr:Nif3-like dinuclear metal center hexameric protein [Thiothrix fructosivorans]MBO0613704.1 Nif3-like dinuclear metal center hexameric protein [Thiothrix fructosivorans]QTX10881.1 Nif3-like dinuclear metal center hexameric protein [Thiothrix fructosivorans]
MNLYALETYLNQLLNVSKFRDYAPNGIQVEGRAEIKRIVTGVSASQALLDAAVEQGADAILVHHGYFWKGESPVIRGMKKRRLMTLLKHDMSLLGYHLPLDAHPEFGNNVQLAQLLGIHVDGVMDARELQGVGNIGTVAQPLSLVAFGQQVASALVREPLLIAGGEHPVQRIAWCTGGAQGYIQQAFELGADTYLSGEISEHTVHFARENGIHYIAAGHHATERYGIQALGEHLAQQFGLEHLFLDLNNPA